MGIIEGGGDILFLNASCGKFVNKKQNIAAKGYSGRLTSIAIVDDEYEGQKTRKVKIMMKDETDATAQISFTLEGWFAQNFFNRIRSIDLSKPFDLFIYGSRENEKVSFCAMKQGDKKVEGEKDFVGVVDVKVGSKTVKDWSKMTDEAEKIVASLCAKLDAMKDKGNTESAPAIDADPADLPF